jgi:putative addiction module CopG family antidote
VKITLSPETEKLISEQVSSGRYRSADEVVREGLELLHEREKDSPRPSQNSGSNLLESVEKLAAKVPGEDWEKVPSDLSRNLDHYLYGARKQS